MTNVAGSAQFPIVERIDFAIEPVEAFRRLSALPHVLFFDSAMRHRDLGRYSFVTADPVSWLIASENGAAAFRQLTVEAKSLPNTWRSDLPPFQGGWGGLLGYELADAFERVPRAAIDEFRVPELAFGLYDIVLAFDHEKNSAWLISQGFPEVDPISRKHRAVQRLGHFRNFLRNPRVAEVDPSCETALPPLILAPQHEVPGRPGLTSNFSADGYRAAVRRVIDCIHAGDIFQANLSQRLLHRATTSSTELYCRLRKRNPAPFAGYLDGGDWQIASASPERFVRVSDREVETRPIKGTRGRALRPEADLFAGDDLRASEKDLAENIMIVDLLRNDLSRTCRADTVHVSQLCGLETYEYVQHLVSVVKGQLKPESSPLEILRTSFPGGSITGAPKIRAMEIIAELEPTARGPYCGTLGYFGVGGQMDTNILIRTITATQGWWQLPVGGGVTAHSDPQRELEETWHKAAGLLRAVHA